MASTFTGSDAGRAGLEITEVDGVPDIFGVNKITVSNTTLTDDGNGAVTITTGGGGGGSGTVTSVGLSAPAAFTITNSPITTSGTIAITGAGTSSQVVLGDGTLGTFAAGTVTSVSTSLGGISITDATTTPAISGTLVVANGGTGAASLNDGGILLGSGTGVITATAVLTNGQLLIGDGLGDPVLATLTGGTEITITNGAGSITIDNDITDNSQIANGEGYTTNVGTVTSISAGSNLNAGLGPGIPITGAGNIDLLFDSYTSSGAAGGAAGFALPPPDDAGKVQSGWITVDVMMGVPPAQTPAYIPLWVNA